MLFIDLIKELELSLNELGEYLVLELAKELKGENHVATGNLIKSIQHKVCAFTSGLQLDITYLKYGRFLNVGIPGSKIPFGGRSRSTGGTSKYIQGIINWIKIKRLTSGLDRDILSFAFAIANTHKKRGYPSPNSIKYSKNGRIIGFQNYVLNTQESKIQERISNIASKAVDTKFTAIISEFENLAA